MFFLTHSFSLSLLSLFLSKIPDFNPHLVSQAYSLPLPSKNPDSGKEKGRKKERRKRLTHSWHNDNVIEVAKNEGENCSNYDQFSVYTDTSSFSLFFLSFLSLSLLTITNSLTVKKKVDKDCEMVESRARERTRRGEKVIRVRERRGKNWRDKVSGRRRTSEVQ